MLRIYAAIWIIAHFSRWECSGGSREELFKKERNKKFIPDNLISGYGQLSSTLVKSSPVKCNTECLKTTGCAQTNIRKLGPRTWSCDLFGWGTGQTEDSADFHHYVMITEFCKEGFSNNYNGSTYCFHLGYFTPTQAEKRCLEDGANQVAIETPDEHTALANYLQNDPDLRNEMFHIGLKYRAGANGYEYVWAGSLKKASYIDWAQGEPNGGVNEPCAVMNYFGNYQLTDVACSDDYNFSYICER